MTSSLAETFRDKLYDPSRWRRSARELVATAKTLEPTLQDFWDGGRKGEWKDGQVAIYFMLCAYALENLMKAILVEKGIAESGIPPKLTSLPKCLKEHDLIKLAQRCGKDALAEEYASILGRLSRSAVWYGRYPVPANSAALASFSAAPSGQELCLTEYSSNDRREVTHLFREFGLQAS